MAKEARAHFLVRAGEWFMAGEVALVGLALLKAGDTFETAHVYVIMERMAHETVWCSSALILAAIRAVALFVNGTVPAFARFSPIVRGMLAIASGMFWCAICLSLYMANTKGMLYAPVAGLGLADFVLSAIIADEAGLLERRLRDARRS